MARWLPIGIGLLLSGCFVEGRRLADEDCDGARICRAGACTLECAADTDRDLRQVCLASRCRDAPGCVGCAARYPNTATTCVHGDCQPGACAPGFVDLDPDAPGCEYACQPTAEAELACDGADDDCDGQTDEGFDLLSDVAHCGACQRACPGAPNATPWCDNGAPPPCS